MTAIPGTTVNVKSAEAEPPPAATVALKPYVPPDCGVPESRPSDDRVRPCGSWPPVSDHVREPEPPDAESVAAYGSVASPCGSEPPLTTRGAGGGGGGGGGGAAAVDVDHERGVPLALRPALVGLPDVEDPPALLRGRSAQVAVRRQRQAGREVAADDGVRVGRAAVAGLPLDAVRVRLADRPAWGQVRRVRVSAGVRDAREERGGDADNGGGERAA